MSWPRALHTDACRDHALVASAVLRVAGSERSIEKPAERLMQDLLPGGWRRAKSKRLEATLRRGQADQALLWACDGFRMAVGGTG